MASGRGGCYLKKKVFNDQSTNVLVAGLGGGGFVAEFFVTYVGTMTIVDGGCCRHYEYKSLITCFAQYVGQPSRNWLSNRLMDINLI